MKINERREAGTPEAGKDASKADSRRDAMKKIAIYSAYATPTLLALMHSKKAQAFSIVDQ